MKGFSFLSEFLKAKQKPLIWKLITWAPSLSQKFVINDEMNKHIKKSIL